MEPKYRRPLNPKQKVSGVLQDANDHIILECALEANAKMIVRADIDLLRLKKIRGTTIVPPTMLQYLT